MKTPPTGGIARLTLRIPEDLHLELQAAAEENGRTVNAEILERLKAGPITQQLRDLSKDQADVKAMLRELLQIAGGQ